MPLKAVVVSPLGVALTLSIGSVVLWRRWPRACRAGVALSIVILWVASCPLTARVLSEQLEADFEALPPQACPRADAIVVLGGCLGESPVSGLGPDLSDAADRVLHAARLFRAGKAPRVVASGGLRNPTPGARPEADLMAELLAEWGVPEGAILREGQSRTTYENAKFTSRVLKEMGAEKVLLVTSAIHMRRALGAFRAFGIDAVPCPTDYSSRPKGRPWVLELLPQAGALEDSTRAIKEILGGWYYRAAYGGEP